MKVTSFLAILSAAVLPCLAQGGTVKVVYDATYDNPAWPLSGTACSNGANGLQSKWPTLGVIPRFPNVGGIPGLTWNSPLCGTCWQLKYVTPSGATSTINIIAVDAAGTFNIAKSAFTTWAGSAAVAAGSVTATATQVASSNCGI